jgi:hypothetical protein
LWSALATVLLGGIESAMGQPETGLAQVERGIASYLGHNSPPVFWPMLTVIRAEAYGRAGRPAEGLHLLDELLGAGDLESTLSQSPDLGLLKGELLLAVSPENAAEAVGIFRAILAGARIIGGKLLVLQAATRLCQLEMQAGNAAESGSALAETYDSFTEGFETADLQAAKAVLEAWKLKGS